MSDGEVSGVDLARVECLVDQGVKARHLRVEPGTTIRAVRRSIKCEQIAPGVTRGK